MMRRLAMLPWNLFKIRYLKGWH